MFSNLLTIDIGSYAIKVAVISDSDPKKLISFGIRVLPHGVVVGGGIQDPKMLEIYLKNLLNEMGVRRIFRRVIISLNGGLTIIKRAKIIRNDAMDTGDQIFLEAEKQFQMDMNELYFDYQVEESETSEFEQIALLAAVKRELLDERVAVIKNAGLQIGIVDFEGFALSNLIEHDYGSIAGIIAIVNIGVNSSNVFFIENGRYLYGREFTVGGDQYTRAISEVTQTTVTAAEEYKIRLSLREVEMSDEVAAAIDAVHEQFYSEFQLSIDFFMQSGESSSGKDTMSGIFLTGGGAQMIGLSEFLQDRFKVQTVILNPFEKMNLSRRAARSDILVYYTMFSVCAGLAMRSFHET